MKNTQTTRKSQPRCSQIMPQPIAELEAKYSFRFAEPTAASRARFNAQLEEEGRDLETWWPDMSRAILEDARRCERIRQEARAELMEEISDWQRERRRAKRAARPKYSRAAMVALEMRGAAQ